MTSPIVILIAALLYAVALLGEVLRTRSTRFALDSTLRVVAGTTILAFVLQTIYLWGRAVGAQASPLSSPHDWCLLASWLLAGAYLYIRLDFPRASLGMFVLPLVLALIGAAQLADQEPFSASRANRFWGNVHGSFLLLGTVAVLFGFVAGLMYLVQSHRLKHKMISTSGFRLPSLEWLQRINSRALVGSLLLIGVGFIAGVILNVVKHQGDEHVPWTDPVIVSSSILLGWLILASVFNLLYPATRRGRKVAYLTLASFAFLVIVLAVLLLSPSQHGSSAGEISAHHASEAGGQR